MGSSGPFIFWKREKADDAWKMIPDTPEALADARKAGAMFTTTCSYAQPPVHAPIERADPFNLAVLRFGKLAFDFDGLLDESLRDTQKLVFDKLPSYNIRPEHVYVYFSGSKGFHVEIPAALIGSQSGDRFLPMIYQRMAQELAGDLPTLDKKIYNMGMGRQFRLPNVRRENGLHKIPLAYYEIDPVLGASIETIISWAKSPREIPVLNGHKAASPEMKKLYHKCRAQVRKQVLEMSSSAAELSDEQRKVLTAGLPRCIQRLFNMEDYGGRELNFNFILYAILIPYFRLAGKTKEEALEISMSWLVAFEGSATYTSPEARIEHFKDTWDQSSDYKWKCGISASCLGTDICGGCAVRALETAEAFDLESPLDAAVPRVEDLGPRDALSYEGDPPAREWIIKDWLPSGEISSLYGDGGMGKSLLIKQLAAAVATKTPFLGLDIAADMPVLCILCEDDQNEIHRRYDAIKRESGLAFADLSPGRLRFWSRVGQNNTLATISKDGTAHLTAFYHAIEAQLSEMGEGPKLLILDTLADLYAGSEIDRGEVNQFVKHVLGGLGLKHQATVLMLAHPSRAGAATGDYLSGSTAWNNAVRNRLVLKAHEKFDDHRVLVRQKSNYALRGEEISLYWERGVFKVAGAEREEEQVERAADLVLGAVTKAAQKGNPISPAKQGARPLANEPIKDASGRLLGKSIKESAVQYLIENDLIEISGGGGSKTRRGYFPFGGVVSESSE
jgi:hypothetical protein